MMYNRYTLPLVTLLFLLFSIGALMVFETTAAEVIGRSLERGTDEILFKQLMYAAISAACAVCIYFLGYETLLRISGFLLLIGTIGLVLTFVPGVGQQINGANRWLRILGNSIQPSEGIKVFLPLYTIYFVKRHRGEMDLRSFMRLALTILIPIGLILIEPDNGTVAILMVVLLVLFILMRIRWVYWAVPLIACTLCGAVVASKMSHVPDRIRIYLDPEFDLKGKGHQPYQAKIATGSGGIWGKGIGGSLQKLDYLPEARSDYIAAIFAEEFGFLGMALLIFLYMMVAGIGLRIAFLSKTKEGFYLAGVMTFLIAFQAFLNLAIVSGLLPSKGTNLPFFSHGGSSLLANCLAVGLILSVDSTKHKVVSRRRGNG